MIPTTILIAGNLGYVGPNVVRHLRKEFPDAVITGLDLGYFSHCLTGPSALPERLLSKQEFMDIRDITPAQLENVDVVVNLAAISNDPMGNAFETITKQINLDAGVRLAEYAKAAGVKRFVFASSCSVYGAAAEGARTELDPVDPLTAYARSKIGTEVALREIADSDFGVTCLRFPTACGMSDRLRLDLVLNDFVASAYANKRIEILSDGTPWRPLIDTNDMALAIEWAATRELSNGGDFLAINAGVDSCNYQIVELAEAVAASLGGVEISVNKEAAPDKRSYQVDFGLWKSLAPNHLPRYTLKDSIESLHHGLEQMAFATTDFRQSDFIRLKVLDGLKAKGLLDENLRWI